MNGNTVEVKQEKHEDETEFKKGDKKESLLGDWRWRNIKERKLEKKVSKKNRRGWK